MNPHASRMYPHRRDLTSVNAHRHQRERRERWNDRKRRIVPRVPPVRFSQHSLDLAFVAVAMYLLGIVTAVSLMTAR